MNMNALSSTAPASTSGLPSTIVEGAGWLRSGRGTAVDLTSTYLARVRDAQDSLGAFITMTDDAALAAAARIDADFGRGIDRGPLQGIPFAIKDLIATEDAPTTANSRVLDPSWGRRPDATVVRRLREAGAVSLGKLALHEFANGWADLADDLPMARNPWDVSRSPGGSSTGAAVAVAAGLVMGAIGTDTAGSIRGPSSCSGVTGLKPTYGRVSREGCIPLAYSLDAIGPLAHTAWDCGLLLEAMAGSDPADSTASPVPVPSMTRDCDGSLVGVRIGAPQQYFMSPEVDAEVKAAVTAALEQMARAGADIRELDLAYADEANAATFVIIRSESFAYHESNLRTRAELYSKYTRRIIQLGAFFTAADLVQAERARSVVRSAWSRTMRDVDVIVTPTMPSLASPFEGHDPDRNIAGASLMGPFNLVGLPAMSVPCGFSESGLPIGLQIVGKPFDEPMVLKVGDAYQRLTDWHLRRPGPPPEGKWR